MKTNRTFRRARLWMRNAGERWELQQPSSFENWTRGRSTDTSCSCMKLLSVTTSPTPCLFSLTLVSSWHHEAVRARAPAPAECQELNNANCPRHEYCELLVLRLYGCSIHTPSSYHGDKHSDVVTIVTRLFQMKPKTLASFWTISKCWTLHDAR